jgi:spoIIIJ-associated protein
MGSESGASEGLDPDVDRGPEDEAVDELGDEAMDEGTHEPEDEAVDEPEDEAMDEGTHDPQDEAVDEPEEEASVDDELAEQADAMADFLEELLERMGIDAIAEPTTHAGHVYVDIVDGPEDDMALLIGRHGQTLDAIQELARTAVGRRLDQRIRVLVDVEDYRKRQDDRLMERAREAAERVEPEHLEPMNAYERKLVHDAVAEVEGVESSSDGVDPERYVVISPA